MALASAELVRITVEEHADALLLPNAALFFWLRHHLSAWTPPAHFLFLLVWFGVNLFYVLQIQPRINRVFNRNRADLVKARVEFLEEIALLKNLEDFTSALAHTLKGQLGFSRADIYVRVDGQKRVYRRYETPWETLQKTSNFRNQLKPNQRLEELVQLAAAESDTACARRMQAAKQKLFHRIYGRKSRD